MNLRKNGKASTSLQPRHFLDLVDWDKDQILALLKDAAKMKAALARGKAKTVLTGKVLGMLFEKPSLRTRVSFQSAMAHLGGGSIFLTNHEVGMGVRESLPDVARNLSQFCDALVLRTFEHATVTEVARWATVPVINGLSDYCHPCQALGDLLTMNEALGTLEGLTVAFVGDGNNVARSLALGCAKMGLTFVLCAPGGYTFDKPFVELFEQFAPKDRLIETSDPKAAVKNADVIYTDVWTSMGQESETAERLKQFQPFQVNEALLARAPKHAKVMHCLPAHRDEEITDGVMESDQSVVFQQAGNRMHIQKALLKWVFGVK
ncbi:MAG: ornithine carbamoyltransferase [Planctomycetota bacterium]